jgi:hypothetical protein
MKTLTAVVLATVIATPALAQSTTNPRVQVPQRGFVQQQSANPAVQQRHSTNRANDVYDNGQYLGSDPDIFIRDQLRLDPPGAAAD